MVKVDMDMPKACISCPLKSYRFDGQYYQCGPNGDLKFTVTDIPKNRHEQCPVHAG